MDDSRGRLSVRPAFPVRPGRPLHALHRTLQPIFFSKMLDMLCLLNEKLRLLYL